MSFITVLAIEIKTFRNEKSLSITIYISNAEASLLHQEVIWCPDPDLNQGHEDFQSSALPTELSGQSLRR